MKESMWTYSRMEDWSSVSDMCWRQSSRRISLSFYIPDMTMRGKGYGSVCMCEILDQLRQKQVTVIRSPFGYALAPIGYTGPDQYRQLMRGFWGATGFEISGDGDEAIQILD